MRYLIIDTEKIEKGQMSEVIFNQLVDNLDADIDNILLSERESFCKFKEIWQDGFDSGWQDGFDGFNKPKNEDLYWNEFKDKL